MAYYAFYIWWPPVPANALPPYVSLDFDQLRRKLSRWWSPRAAPDSFAARVATAYDIGFRYELNQDGGKTDDQIHLG